MADTLDCPFCGYKNDMAYAIQLHIEEHHTDDSPFTVQGAHSPASLHGGRSRTSKPKSKQPSEPEEPWTKCTRPSCSELVHLEEIDEHLEMHDAIAAVEEDERGSRGSKHSSSRSSVNSSTRDHHSERSTPPREHLQRKLHRSTTPTKKVGLLRYFSGTSITTGSTAPRPKSLTKYRRPTGRLGTKELGPQAFEKSMPQDVRYTLEHAARPRDESFIDRDGALACKTIVPNETHGLVPVLADLSSQDPKISTAYFCSSTAVHVRKIQCEGNFCGYWNIQMQLAHLRAVDPDLSNRDRTLPNVLMIQQTIEDAWDAGICAFGRVETGGIRNTRKWIGTQEVAAYFTHTGRPVQALSLKSSEDTPQPANTQLLDWAEAYFIAGLEGVSKQGTSDITQRPPIFFQRAGHSMTIVGLERREDGARNLIVFDPSFATNSAMKRLVDGKAVRAKAETLLTPYRHCEYKLARWKEYEVLACVER